MFNSYEKNASLKKVLNGDFPEQDVKKMNRRYLESFVLKLVQCSSNVSAKNAKSFTGLYKSLCLKQINKPEWWPSEKIIEQSLTSDGKYFMELMRFLVYKCCEYFRKPCENLNDKLFVIDNDENLRGVKRKCDELYDSKIPCKRRTLMPRNVTASTTNSITLDIVNKNPIVCLKDIFYKHKPKPLKQSDFLSIFGLQSTFSPYSEDPQVPPPINTTIKFISCPVIPCSSDLGRMLSKRDNHTFPEFLRGRKLERLEWYVNQPSPRYTATHYEVSYQEKKELTFHSYKFPKRTFWQHPGDVEYQKKSLICRPLKILVARDDLEKLRRKLKVVLDRMPFDCCIKKPQVKKKGNGQREGLRHKEKQKTL